MDRNQLGEIIYEKLISKKLPGETAKKIAGMILEMEQKQIIDILSNEKAMDLTVDEALKALGEKPN